MEIALFMVSNGGFYEAQTVLRCPVKQITTFVKLRRSQDDREAVNFSTLKVMLQARWKHRTLMFPNLSSVAK